MVIFGGYERDGYRSDDEQEQGVAHGRGRCVRSRSLGLLQCHGRGGLQRKLIRPHITRAISPIRAICPHRTPLIYTRAAHTAVCAIRNCFHCAARRVQWMRAATAGQYIVDGRGK